jgi:hypothetical protein
MAHFVLRTEAVKGVSWPALASASDSWPGAHKDKAMLRTLAITAFTLFLALPAYSSTRQARAAETHPALHLMSDGEFALFLGRLDSSVLRWKAQLRHLDVKTLGLETRESDDLGRSYNRCVQALDNTQEEIQKLSRKQRLELDFLLLMDLNDLARNLDGFNRDLASPLSLGRRGSDHRSLGYAREVLGIDVALEPMIVEFEHHLLAFAGAIDETHERTQEGADPPPQAQN